MRRLLFRTPWRHPSPWVKSFSLKRLAHSGWCWGGCGSAAIAANFPYLTGADIAPGNPLGLGYLGVSLAFGLTVVTMAYAIGHISGCHLNPAVSFGLWASGRMKGSELLPYIGAQVIGGVLAGGFIKLVVAGGPALELVMGGSNPLATNGWGAHSPGGYGFLAALVVEVVLTFFFLLVIIGATDRLAPSGFAGVAIGLTLALIHMISIPVTNTSVNPARSTGVAVWAGVEALGQLWLFWVAPIVGALIAGWVYRNVFSEQAS